MHRYNVGEDCPYYNDGYISTTLDLQVHLLFQNLIQLINPPFLFLLFHFYITGIQTPNGIEIEGPNNELYLQIPYVSNIILGR